MYYVPSTSPTILQTLTWLSSQQLYEADAVILFISGWVNGGRERLVGMGARIQNLTVWIQCMCTEPLPPCLVWDDQLQCGAVLLLCGHMTFQNKKKLDLKANVEIEP